MRRYFVLAVVAIAIQALCPVTSAWAQDDEMPCDAFTKNPDGSWTATRAAFIVGPNFSVRVGGVFRPGDKYKDYDLAAHLAEACRNAPPPQPQAVTQAQPPRAALSHFADANGNIDIQHLTCGHLADASGEEAALLLAWYSGTYSGPPKRRPFNVAQLRYAIRNIVDYCKSSRDTKLVQVMEHYLK
jgi:hypothetical protein